MAFSGCRIVLKGQECLLAGVVDITERKRIEHALMDETQRLQLATASSGLGVWDWDLRTDAMAWDPRMFELYGVSPNRVHATVEDWKDGVHPEDLARAIAECEAAIKGERPFDTEFRVLHPDGTILWIKANAIVTRDAEGTPLRMIGLNRDITDLRRAEQDKAAAQMQLMQSQKMESLGTLAGGVAHDMNNVLAAILGLSTAQLMNMDQDHPDFQVLNTIQEAASRGRSLVKSLLGFARQAPAEERELDLNEILREVFHLLERTTMGQIRLEADLAPDLRPVRGDGSALHHAFLNLCVNAVDAMPHQGSLRLRTRNLAPDRVEVIVEDTGTGMTPEVLAKALDPFFTTKEVGKGTGLGLPMAFNAVTAHRGHFEIQSQPGQGTRIRMHFPAHAVAAAPPEPGPQAFVGPSAGSLLVLIVDDDELILKSTRMLVEILGHAATPALSGEQAIALLEEGFRPDVVVLDMNMPGLGGLGTLPRLRTLCPSTPVLLATGRLDQAALDLAAAHPFVALLPKPFSIDELQAHLLLVAER